MLNISFKYTETDAIVVSREYVMLNRNRNFLILINLFCLRCAVDFWLDNKLKWVSLCLIVLQFSHQ